jgi:hypothetical protein
LAFNGDNAADAEAVDPGRDASQQAHLSSVGLFCERQIVQDHSSDLGSENVDPNIDF